jgi:hypothetical protein
LIAFLSPRWGWLLVGQKTHGLRRWATFYRPCRGSPESVAPVGGLRNGAALLATDRGVSSAGVEQEFTWEGDVADMGGRYAG